MKLPGVISFKITNSLHLAWLWPKISPQNQLGQLQTSGAQGSFVVNWVKHTSSTFLCKNYVESQNL